MVQVVHRLLEKPTRTEDGQQERAIMSPRRGTGRLRAQESCPAGEGRWEGQAGQDSYRTGLAVFPCVPWGGGRGIAYTAG